MGASEAWMEKPYPMSFCLNDKWFDLQLAQYFQEKFTGSYFTNFFFSYSAHIK